MNKVNIANNVAFFGMLLLLCNSTLIISSDEAADEVDAYIEESVDKPEKHKTSAPKKNSPTSWTQKNNSIKKALRSERKLFVNGQDSPVSIIVTDKNNQQHYYSMPAGTTRIVEHVPLHIKKIVCTGKYQEKDISIPGTALNTYSVFIFGLESKLEQMHYIDIKQKTEMLNRAKNALRQAQLAFKRDKQAIEKLAKKVEDIQEQTIYYL